MIRSVRDEIRKKWKPRDPRSHKGDFGRVLILAGSRGLTGAAGLCGMGAARSGAGLVTVGVPDAVYPIIARGEAEVMVRPFPSTRAGTLSLAAAKPILEFLKTQDIFAMGPGLSGHRGTRRLIHDLVRRSPVPMVLDADALNAFEGKWNLLTSCKKEAVLTPHPAEFTRVFGGRTPLTEKARRVRAVDAARKSGCVVVLKGGRTVIASPEGKVFINTSGNPGMASGGTGDVLTGIIAALAGQGFSLFDAARFGVYFHGLAGDFAAREKGEVSMIAGDLLECLPKAFRRVLKR